MEQDYIEKHKRSDFHLDINALYKRGIELIQNYSGYWWTDYNAHDPGVTILENLVLAIAELSYRMGFETVDYLVDDEGNLNTETLALYLPHEILTSHPVIIDDFRKVIFDRIGEIGNVWIEVPGGSEDRNTYYSNAQGSIKGLYSMYLSIKPEVLILEDVDHEATYNELKDSIKDQVSTLWPSLRNLGEDLDEDRIIVLDRVEIMVDCEIVLDGSALAENVLAIIILRLDDYFNPELRFDTLNEMLAKGKQMNEIFEGPHLKNGFIDDYHLNKKKIERITRAEILSIISKVGGVSQIEHLEIRRSKEKNKFRKLRKEIVFERPKEEIVFEEDEIPRFIFEVSSLENVNGHQILQKTYKDNSYLTVRMREKNSLRFSPVNYQLMLKTLRREQSLQRSNQTNIEKEHLIPRLPKGRPRSLDHYSSIQNDFPHIYAINQFGLSKYESPKRKSEQLQLKAYLILFEQLIANFTAQVANLKSLYSIESLNTTYYNHPLTSSDIEGIEKLYFETRPDQGSESILKRMLSRLGEFYDHADRKSRLLDYMLALYGESYSAGMSTPKDVEDSLKTKVELLKNLKTFNHNSAKGPQLKKKLKIQELSGFQLKTAIWLGISPTTFCTRETLKEAIKTDEYNVTIVSEKDVGRDPYKTWQKSLKISADAIQKIKKYTVSLDTFEKPDSYRELKSIKYIKIFSYHYISRNLLRSGLHPGNYMVFKKSGQFVLVVHIENEGPDEFLEVDSFSSLNKVIEAGYQFIETLELYNKRCERFILIDHIMLRYRKEEASVLETLDPEFYSLKCSILFPEISVRFSDPIFQQTAEELIYSSIPAHIVPHINWLPADDYQTIEELYYKWADEPERYREELIMSLPDFNTYIKKQEDE
ncbi:MAG: hypothetical protein AAGI25_08415 [Bacteroidota bacterium]